MVKSQNSLCSGGEFRVECGGMEDDATAPLQMRDMKEDDRPREKLVRLGRAMLTDEELIALFLRTGLHGCNVLELAGQLKRRAGSLAALGGMEAADIHKLCKGIGPAKAATLAAVFELGRRAAQEAYAALPMADAATVYHYLSGELRYEEQENLIALLLDARHCLLRRVTLYRGTLTRLIVHPRDVFREAIRHNASAFIIVHNHPSGDPAPSRLDESLTTELVEAGKMLRIPVLDHVIIGSPADNRPKPYYSFRENRKAGLGESRA